MQTPHFGVAPPHARRGAEIKKVTILSSQGNVDATLARHDVARLTADRDAARAAVEKARADLADARLRLDRCTVTSPVSGIVIERLTTVGSNVAPGPPQHSAHIVHVYDPRELQVRADECQTIFPPAGCPGSLSNEPVEDAP